MKRSSSATRFRSSRNSWASGVSGVAVRAVEVVKAASPFSRYNFFQLWMRLPARIMLATQLHDRFFARQELANDCELKVGCKNAPFHLISPISFPRLTAIVLHHATVSSGLAFGYHTSRLKSDSLHLTLCENNDGT
jgi:hypothetical protein